MKKVMIVIIIVMTLLLFRCYQKNNILEHRERIFTKWNMTNLMSYRILSLSDPYYKRLSKLKMYGNCNSFITGLRLLEINDDVNETLDKEVISLIRNAKSNCKKFFDNNKKNFSTLEP